MNDTTATATATATANAAANIDIARYKLAQARRMVAYTNTTAEANAAEGAVFAAHNALRAARNEWTRLERAERAEMLAAPRSVR